MSNKLSNSHRKATFADICSGWWPTALVVALVLYITLAPSPVGAEELPPIPGLDKWIHAILGGGVASALIFDSARWRRTMPSLTAVLAIALCSMAFMALDEVSQSMMNMGRQSDPLDLLADWGGILAASILAPPAVRRTLNLR